MEDCCCPLLFEFSDAALPSFDHSVPSCLLFHPFGDQPLFAVLFDDSASRSLVRRPTLIL